MRKERTLFVLGFIIIGIAFSGFPEMWRQIFFVIIGLLLIYLAHLFYKQAREHDSADSNQMHPFVDNIEK